MPIPDSELPGHSQLHERVVAALDRCQEDQDIEFKEAGTWPSLKWKIIRTVLGMGNLRDGGFIVVGVSERGDRWELTGVDLEQRQSFDPDDVIAQVNAYVSPHVEVGLVLVRHASAEFVAIDVKEFPDTPLVCMKNGPDGESILKGRIYVRPPGKSETTMIRDATDLHDLLELAAEKRARRMLEVSRRIGMVEGPEPSRKPDADDQFDAELGDLR